MPKKISLPLILMAVITLSHVACAQKENYTGPVLKVQKDKLYQIIRLSIKEGKQEQFNQYFASIGAKVAESGAKAHSFAVMEAGTGNGPAQMIMIAEFEDRNAADVLYKSKEFFQNRNSRDHSLSYLSEGFFRASADGEFPIGKTGRLEIISMWIEEDKQEQLNEYFNTIMPEALSLGAEPAPFVFVPALEQGNYHAQTVFLGLWKDDASRDKFYNSQVFKTNKSKRDAALKFLEEYHIQLIPDSGQ